MSALLRFSAVLMLCGCEAITHLHVQVCPGREAVTQHAMGDEWTPVRLVFL